MFQVKDTFMATKSIFFPAIFFQEIVEKMLVFRFQNSLHLRNTWKIKFLSVWSCLKFRIPQICFLYILNCFSVFIKIQNKVKKSLMTKDCLPGGIKNLGFLEFYKNLLNIY